MTPRALGSTALRVVGIYLFVQVLVSLPGVIGFLSRIGELDVLGNTTFYFVVTVVPPLILLICGVLLFFGSGTLSKRLFASDSAVEPLSRGDVEAVAFAVAGIWVFGCSLPGLTGSAGNMVSEVNKIGEAGHADIPWRSALAYGAQALVGLLLFLQAGSVARWWSRRVDAGRGREVRHDA